MKLITNHQPLITWHRWFQTQNLSTDWRRCTVHRPHTQLRTCSNYNNNSYRQFMV